MVTPNDISARHKKEEAEQAALVDKLLVAMATPKPKKPEKKPFVLKPELTDRPFKNHPALLEIKRRQTSMFVEEDK